ncbi:Hypothetical predicted protein [Pelobates cultripes]|uniref:Uncharacterized protein n=1 Tax=Pelobates cultripes TaxID=61616 RepID=A0AAD1WET4_PELCU|nr:Hypothetical predicted protein [Pelobates cultripes]
MPFVYHQKGRKARHTNKAYTDYKAFETALYSTALPPTENTTTDLANMGRKFQRIATGVCRHTQDVSAVLQHTAAPKMAATPYPDTSSTCSEAAMEDNLHQQPSQDTQTDPDALTPATKLDIKNLLMELKQMSAADMALMKTEVQAVTDQVKTTEDYRK